MEGGMEQAGIVQHENKETECSKAVELIQDSPNLLALIYTESGQSLCIPLTEEKCVEPNDQVNPGNTVERNWDLNKTAREQAFSYKPPDSVLNPSATTDVVSQPKLVLTNFVLSQPFNATQLTDRVSTPQAASESLARVRSEADSHTLYVPCVPEISSHIFPATTANVPEKRKRGPGRPKKTRSRVTRKTQDEASEEESDTQTVQAASRTRSGRLSKPPIISEPEEGGSQQNTTPISLDFATSNEQIQQESNNMTEEFESPLGNDSLRRSSALTGRTWKRGRRKNGPYWLHTPAMQQIKKGHRLAEALDQLDDDEFLTLVGSRVAACMTSWYFLLAKARKKNQFAILPTLLAEIKNLTKTLSAAAKETMVPHVAYAVDQSSNLYELADPEISELVGLPCGTYEIVNNTSLFENANSSCQTSQERTSPSPCLARVTHEDMWATMADVENHVKDVNMVNALGESSLKLHGLFPKNGNDKDESPVQSNGRDLPEEHHHDSVSLSGLGVTDLLHVDDIVHQTACDVGSTDSLLLTLRPDLPTTKKLVTQFDLAAMEAFAIPGHGEDSNSSLPKDFFAEAMRKSFPNC